jgi:integrase
VVKLAEGQWRASWPAKDGSSVSVVVGNEREAVAQVVEHAHGGLRFHDLRHSYATWLVTDGVPVNIVQKVMGHEQASATLNRYTHTPDDYGARVLAAFWGPADSALTFPTEAPAKGSASHREDARDQAL